MPYIKNGTITPDPWVRVADDEPLPADAPAIVSAARLAALDEAAFAQRTAPLGVVWPNNEPVSSLAPHLDRLALIALVFPAFRDGRAYTQARQLREQYGFQGELRATGDVLRDQFLFMVRAGFDGFEVKKEKDASSFAKALHEFSVLYQPPADGRPLAFRERALSHHFSRDLKNAGHV